MSSVGDEVIDGFKQTSSWLKHNTDWLEDLSEFYRDRAAIEREAAGKLTALTSKHFSKKASVSAAISVGDSPDTTPGSLENGSLQAWMEVLNQTEAMATERKKLADDLSTHVADAFAAVRARYEELRTRYKTFNSHLEDQRDEAYNQVKKTKSAYDSACEHMESARSRNKKIDSRENEMYNAKTAYLLAINVANRMKDKYYHDDIPELLDTMQIANEFRVAQFNRILKNAADVEKHRLAKETACLDGTLKVLAKNDPSIDSRMFIEHNIHQFTDPTDFYFQESPIWHDNDEFPTKSDSALHYIRAKLGDAEAQATESTTESEKRHEAYERARDGVRNSRKKGDASAYASESIGHTAPLLKAHIAALEKLIGSESVRVKAEVEIEAIEAGTAGVNMSAIPVTRTTTHRTLLGKKKEVVEVVDAGGRPKATRHLGLKSLLARTANMSLDDGKGKAFVLYDFESGGTGELSVPAGASLVLVEPDDGSGWVRVKLGNDIGLVPASYLEITQQAAQASQAPKQAPLPPPSRGTAAATSGQNTMVALYNYDATDASQLSIKANDQITVVTPDSGNGWTTGRIGNQQGLFPTSYARAA